MSANNCYICNKPANVSCHWCIPDKITPKMIGRWICDDHCVYMDASDTVNLPLSCCKPCQQTVVGIRKPQVSGYYYG